jgi:hypothetical protein
MDQTIEMMSRECHHNFEELGLALSTDEGQVQTIVSSLAVTNELGRFRIWASNIGALGIGTTSLDYRLRDAEYLFFTVKSLLESLRENLEDGFIILTELLTW